MFRLNFIRLMIVIGLVVLASPAVFADDPVVPACDATTLKGNYSFNLTGSFYDSNGYWYVMALVGMSTFDGAGNFSGTDALSLDGTIRKRTVTGTYVVNTDCTGTLTITGSDKVVFNGNIVIINKALEVDFIDTDTDVIFSGVIKKQNP